MSYGTPLKRDPTPEGSCPRAVLEVTVTTNTGRRHYEVLVPAGWDTDRVAHDIAGCYHDDDGEWVDIRVVEFGGGPVGDLEKYREWHNEFYSL